MEANGQLHAPEALTPREKARDTYRISSRVGPRAGLEVVVVKKPYLESNPDRPAQSLVLMQTRPGTAYTSCL